jgi:membrane fusion protein (multidrug efflux system)
MKTQVTVLVSAAVAATLSGACKEKEVPPPPPPEVYVAPVVQKDVPVYLDLVGQTQGFQDVEIRARVEGFLDSVKFREGSFVRKGELLYEIDPRPLQATLAQANADLATARARLAKSDNDVARYEPLVLKQAVSQRELDDSRASQEATRSEVDAAKAAVEKATLDLGYTRIMSPINGLAGTTQVKPGSLVGRGESTLLTTVSHSLSLFSLLSSYGSARSQIVGPGPRPNWGIEVLIQHRFCRLVSMPRKSNLPAEPYLVKFNARD